MPYALLMAAEGWEEKNVHIKVASDGQNEGEGKGWGIWPFLFPSPFSPL